MVGESQENQRPRNTGKDETMIIDILESALVYSS